MNLEDRVSRLEKGLGLDNTTEIFVVLDRSGSMISNKLDHEDGLQRFVGEQKKEGAVSFTLVQFDDIDPFEVVYDNVPIKEVGAIKLMPRGSTPLYDAIGKTINRADNGSLADKIIYIISDGQENASKEFTKSAIRQLIEQKKANGWQFMFLGTNFDVLAEGTSVGLDAGKNVQYTNSTKSIRRMYNTVSSKTGEFKAARASGSSISASSTKLDFSQQEIKEINDES